MMGSHEYARLEALFRSPSLMELLPDAALKLIRLIDADAPNRELELVVASDPALAASVLRAATGAAYGAHGPTSLGGAILMLGQITVRNLALSLAIQAMLNRHPTSPDFNARTYSRHSLFVAFLAGDLHRRTGGSRQEVQETFAMAALHDLAIGLLAITAARTYSVTAAAARNHGLSFDLAFRNVFGESIFPLGKLAADSWGLPGLFGACMAALANEGAPEPEGFSSLLLADLLATQHGVTYENWKIDKVDDLFGDVTAELDAAEIEEAVKQAHESIDHFVAMAA